MIISCQVSPIKGKTTKEGCSTLLSRPPFSSNMGKKNDLSAAEKHEIVESLGHVMKTLDISRKFKRDHHNVKRFVAESEHTWVRADKGTMMKVSARQIHLIKITAAKRPLQSNRYLKLLVPLEPCEHQGVGSSRDLQLCINFIFGHP